MAVLRRLFLACGLCALPLQTPAAGEETGIVPGGSNGADSLRILLQNYPNPFRERTIFQFYMPVRGRVTISIFDTRGKEVITIVDQEIRRGPYTLRWRIRGLSNGVYYYRLRTPAASAIKKMTLMN